LQILCAFCVRSGRPCYEGTAAVVNRCVLESLHSRIVAENAYPIEVQPLPHEITAAGQVIFFGDLWNSFPDEGGSG
jgi:hypothetical protein